MLGERYAEELRRLAAQPERQFAIGLRSFLVARSRFAEENLRHAVDAGVRQYVLLGVGLDTFGYRNPHFGLRVFEVDHPATQAWKRDLLARSGISVPKTSTFVPVDFETQTLPSQLAAAGFDFAAPAFFGWLGVVPYLTLDAFRATLAFVAERPSGSGVALDYRQPREALPLLERMAHDALAERVQRVGEPFRLFFTPQQWRQNLLVSGRLRIWARRKSTPAILRDAATAWGSRVPRGGCCARGDRLAVTTIHFPAPTAFVYSHRKSMLRNIVVRTLTFLFLLSATLTAAGRDSNATWLELKSPHFTVLTDSNEKQARHVAGQLERMRAVFHTLFPEATADSGAPIIVLALKDKKDFQALEPAAYLAKGQLDLAGLFLNAPDKNYILLRLDAQGEHPFATVYHEYTHLMLSKAAEWMPLWLNEGLAEFYQNTDILDKEVRLGQPSADDILYLRQNRLMPLPVLFKVDHSSPYYHEEQKGSVFYAESWALTHYLMVADHDKATTRLTDYVKLVSQHQDPVIAAQTAFGDLNRLQSELSGYVNHGDYKLFTMKTLAGVDESSFQVKSIPAADANATRADVLVYTQRPADAKALLDQTLRDDPNNALAHETMGFLKFREGDIADAKKWYGQAVRLDSQSYLAHYYFAVMSMREGDRDHDDVIESSLQTSIKLNAQFAPVYEALAGFYGSRHIKLNEAHLLNVRAVTLDPGNIAYRIHGASILMEEGQPENALRVLDAAAKVAKKPAETAMVQSERDRIQQYESARKQANAEASIQTTMIGSGNTGGIISKAEQHALPGPKYPTDPPTGPRHTARGVLRDVQCSYPTVITLNVDTSGKKTSLYSNNVYRIEYSASNFEPGSNFNPCKGMEGMKAIVEYAEVSDKTIAGQILSIQLTK